MAIRPAFTPSSVSNSQVEQISINFVWNSGFAWTQKEKNRTAFHAAIASLGFDQILEVSTKSDKALGIMLSAFNLKIDIAGFGPISVESAFQGSKVFGAHGASHDLYRVNPRDAKREARLRDRGDLQHFDFFGNRWELEPKTAFYDWLYLQALSHLPNETKSELATYQVFTDVEFNPKKSLNCQARSCALAVALIIEGALDDVMESKATYLKMVAGLPTPILDSTKKSAKQLRLK